MSQYKRYLMASADAGRYLTLNEWRELENKKSYEESELPLFEVYLAIEKKRLEAFNLDVLYADIRALE